MYLEVTNSTPAVHLFQGFSGLDGAKGDTGPAGPKVGTLK